MIVIKIINILNSLNKFSPACQKRILSTLYGPKVLIPSMNNPSWGKHSVLMNTIAILLKRLKVRIVYTIYI